jgi:hypothetical protein
MNKYRIPEMMLWSKNKVKVFSRADHRLNQMFVQERRNDGKIQIAIPRKKKQHSSKQIDENHIKRMN